MSVGRPDPYASKIFSPEQYNRNRARIDDARTQLEEFERMNEIGKKNFELAQQKEKEEREERELAQKIQEGELAKQRLQQLRQRKSLPLTNGSAGSASWIGAGSSSALSPQENIPLQQNFSPHPQSVPQSMGQSTYVPHSEQSSYHNHRNQAQQFHNTTPGTYTASAQPPYYRDHSQSRQPQIQQVYNAHYAPPYEAPRSSASTHQQSGPPFTPATSVPLLDLLMPAYPTIAQVRTIKQYLDQWAATVPPQTQYNATIIWDTYTVKCFKNKDGIIIFSIQTPNGPIDAAAHKILDDFLARAEAPQPNTKNTTAAGKASSSSTQTFGPTMQRLFPPFRSLAATSDTLPPIARHPVPAIRTQISSTVPASVASSSSSTYTRVAQSVPVPQNTTSAQTIPSLVPNPSPAVTAPSSIIVPDVAKQHIVSSSAVKVPDSSAVQGSSALSIAKDAPIPVKHAISEGSASTGLTPQQADKTRIAQSLLWALGKRLRQSSSSNHLQHSKRHASEAAIQAQNVSDKTQASAKYSSPHIHTDASNNSQNPAQLSTGGSASVTASQTIPPKPVQSSQPHTVSTSTSSSMPIPNVQPNSDAAAPVKISQHYPNVAHNIAPSYNEIQYVPLKPSNLGPPLAGPSSQVHSSSASSVRSQGPNVPLSHTQPIHIEPPLAYTILSHTNSSTGATLINPPISYLQRKQLPNAASSASVQTAGSVVSKTSPISNEAKSTLKSNVATNLKSEPVSAPTSIPVPPSTIQSSSSSTTNASVSHTFIGPLGAKSPVASTSSSSKKTQHSEEPLFLPSSSPESGPPFSRKQSETPVSSVANASKVATRIVHRAYVLVPSAPDYLVRHRKQLKRQRSASGGLQDKELPVSLPDSVAEEEDFWYTFESQRGSPSDENEREAIRLACSRLQPSPCKWDGCNAVMNSGEALIRHLNLHKPEPGQNVRTFMCRWTQCGQQGVRFEDSQHLKKHALLPLRCAYMDCKDSFRSRGQLLKHFRKRHADGALKPSAKPEAPTTEADVLPDIPAPFPSYLLSTDIARGEVLSRERHMLVGQQVLTNITFVDDGAPLKRRSKKTARPASRALPDPTAHLTNDYQFLTNKNSARSSTYSSKACDIDHADLDSAQISRMIEQGIVFWGTEDEADGSRPAEAVTGVSHSPLFSPEPAEQASDAEIKLEADTDTGTGAEPSYDHSGVSVSRQPHFDESHTSDVEDAAVENMLTDMTLTER